jgi:hypothetical protein
VVNESVDENVIPNEQEPIEIALGDIIDETPKKRSKPRKTKELKNKNASSILSEQVSSEEEEKIFYQEEITQPPPDVAGVSYKRGVSV